MPPAVRVVPPLSKKLISVRTREDEQRIKKRMIDKEFDEIDQLLRRADATL